MTELSERARAFVDMLNEPKNTLGRTEQVVAMVLVEPELIDDLYQCYFQPDEWVRLRVSSSFKRLWRADEELVVGYLDGFIDRVSTIDQPSVQWTFAQLCLELDHRLTATQRAEAKERIKANLDGSDDWIVQNTTIETLGRWALDDASLATWLKQRLQALANSHRTSVARRAIDWLDKLS